MATPITFSAIRIKADNTNLEQDENGYYRVILGAINAFNSAGDFYISEGVNDLISNQSSSLARRIKSGYLKGEVGHPILEPGMTKSQYYARNMRIDQNNVSHHIRDVILTPTNEPCGIPGGGNIILIEGWVKPAGSKGDALKKALDNPDENVAFSIRSFTQDMVQGGVNRKKLLQIITWDWVVEPGIKFANKFDKVDGRISIESFNLCTFNTDELGINGNIAECFNCSLESNDEREMTKELISSIERNNLSSVVMTW